jgi:predicted transcriptional regulator
MVATTIKIYPEIKMKLDEFREYRSESYNDIIGKVIGVIKVARNEPRLSQRAIKEIEKARERMNRGEYYTMEEVCKHLARRKVRKKSR